MYDVHCTCPALKGGQTWVSSGWRECGRSSRLFPSGSLLQLRRRGAQPHCRRHCRRGGAQHTSVADHAGRDGGELPNAHRAGWPGIEALLGRARKP